MKKNIILLFIIFMLPALTAMAGDVLTFRPIKDVSQLKSGARTLIGAEWYGKYYVLYNDMEPSAFIGNPAHEVTLNSDGNLEYTREQLHMSHERNHEKPILFRMSCSAEGTHGYLDLRIFDDFQYYWVPGTSDTPWAKKSLVFRQGGYYFDSSWEASFYPENDFIFWGNADGYTVDHSHIFIVNSYKGLSSGNYLSYLIFRGPESEVSKQGFTTNSYMDYDLLEYDNEGNPQKIDTHIVLFQEVECTHDAIDITTFNGIAPTCTLPGRTAVKYCKGCNKYFTSDFAAETASQGEYIEPLGHKVEGDHCSRCGKEFKNAAFELGNLNTWTNSNNIYNCSAEWTFIAQGEDGKYYVPGRGTSPNGKGIEAVELTQAYASNNAFYRINTKDFAWISFSNREYSNNQWMLNCDDAYLEAAYDGSFEYNGYDYNSFTLRWASKELINYPTTAPWQGIHYAGNIDYWMGNRTNGKVNVYYPDGNMFHYICLLKDEDGNYYYGLSPQYEYGTDNRSEWQKPYHTSGSCTHEHLEFIPGVEVTCTKGGNTPYYYCTDCYQEFADNELSGCDYYEIHLEPLGHNYVDGACTRCGRPAQSYALITEPKQITAGRKYIIVAKAMDGKSEQYYVMGEIGGKVPYGTATAVPVQLNDDGTIDGGNSEFSELDIVEVPRGSVYNKKQEPLYYFVLNGHSIRSYKGLDLGGLSIDPEQDFISQLQKNGYINGLQEFDGDNNYIQSGALLAYLNGKDWKGLSSFANITNLEPNNAVIYPKGVFEDPNHCLGLVDDGMSRFFCTWYQDNPNTQLPNIPVYIYGSTDAVVNYNQHMGTLYVEESEPIYPSDVVDQAIRVQEESTVSKPLTCIDLSNSELADDFSVSELQNRLFYNKELQVSENALIFLPESYTQGKDDGKDMKKAKGDGADGLTNIVVGNHSSRIQLADAQDLAIADDFWADEFEYTKTLTNRWSTLVLPAAVNVPDGVEALELTGVDLENLTITFSSVDQLTPNVPVIVRKTSEGDEASTFAAFDVEVKSTTGQIEDVNMRGTYTGLVAGEAEALGYHILATDNMFHPAGPNATVAPFRAYLVCSTSGDKGDDKGDGGKDDIKKAKFRITFDESTSIASLPQGQLLQIILGEGTVTLRGKSGLNVTIADTAGRIVKRISLNDDETTVSLPAGVYIINGTKVSIK